MIAQPIRALSSVSRHLPWGALALWCFAYSTISLGDDLQGFQLTATMLTNARIHVEPGKVIERGMILIRDGRIVDVGPELLTPPDAEVLDLNGLIVYPGFVDAGSSTLISQNVNLPEVEPRNLDIAREALASLPADRHSGLTPQWSSHQALVRASAELDKFRQAGFTTVHVVPQGRIASGQSSVVQLSGQPPREAVLVDGFGSTFRIWERRGNEYPSTMMGIFAHLRQHFFDAERAALQQQLIDAGQVGVIPPPLDPVWTALHDVRTGKRRAIFEVESRDDVERAISLSRELNLQPILWGWQQGPFSTELLVEHQVPVMLRVDFGEEPKQAKPDDKSDFPKVLEPQQVVTWKRDRWRNRVKFAEQLRADNIPFAISTAGLKSPGDIFLALRQLKEAGVAEQTILSALTTQPAEILGLKDRGRIAAGQTANLTILNGPLTHEQVKVRYVFVDGKRFEYHPDAKPIAESIEGAASAADLSGTWNVKIETGSQPLPATFEISSTTGSPVGRFTSGQGNGLITGGKNTVEHVEIEVSIGAGDAAVMLKFAGKLTDQKIAGTLKSPFGPPAGFSATRQSAEPVASPLVEMNSIETSEDDAEPISALSSSGTSKTKTSELPLEFPEDRTARHRSTGGNVLIRNGTVITGTGQTLPGTLIWIENGTITQIGPNLEPLPGMAIIEADGLYVMPGMIDTHSHIMISNGLGGVNEATASIVCEVRVRDVVNTADPQEYRALAGGATTLRLLHGSANVVGGQDAIVQLKHGVSAVEHLLPNAPSGVKFALGENVKYRSGRFPNTRLGVEATLQRAFVEALEYRRDWQEYHKQLAAAGDAAPASLPPRRDLRLEALAEILSQEKFIHSHCYRSDEILMLLRVADQLGIRVRSLQHVLEGYKVAPEIVAHGASCSTFADWWAYKVEAYDATPHNAALLHAAGANVVIKSDNDELMRHLNQEAAKPVRYGNLPPDVALSLVTLNPARELGIDDRLGSIEVGKQGDVALFNAHPLNTFARCEMTLIAGEPYFVRAEVPSAMTETGLAASTKPSPIELPAPEDRKPDIDWSLVEGSRFALVGATLHPVDSPDIPQGFILCENGKIVALGTADELKIPQDVQTIDVTGLHIYPGLIDAGTTLGLTEIGKVVETHDYAEVGQFQPDLRAGVAINPDSELIPVARAGGITTALIRPTGGVIAGQASIMQLAGWTAPEMTRVPEAGLQIQWPGAHDNKQQLEELREWLKAARIYDAARSAAAEAGGLPHLVDPRYEALRPYVRKERPIFIEAHSEQHLSEVLRFAKLENVRVVLCGASAAWKLAKEIREADIPVIVGPVMREPTSAFEPYDAVYANPGRLHEAGVKFCIRSDNAANSRNAPFEAGMAVAYGLPEEVALRSVTLSSAEILGIADDTGSLTPGKRADLVILDGSPLQVTSQVKGVVIAGQPFRPESRQTRFAEKYRQRILQP